ncbi:uncharacterized protein LOC104896847 [Beta vulgaris subsp. vulgaris]|uniref:uncharacterized protein LOC104896847 n=1 Tax=Beta vulgaris subsp. vulgaris TaxID=3555 RepID=UPI00203671F3|nr:uncharacterized protein LOC104896847 [Beta vulgaris subsp. vulgaris]
MNYGSSIVDCNPSDIPLYDFEFVPFDDILAKKDIIGQLTTYGEVTKTAKSKCMTIELVDTKYADEMINYINAEGANGAIIVIIQFAKRIMYKGGVLVQNSRYASRLFIIRELPEITAFKDSMCCKTEQISGQLTQLTNESADFLKEEYVKDIFDSVEMKRFKIKLIVADKSGDASFMIFDKEVSKLVGTTAKEMVASQNQIENNEFPEEFKGLLGKRFLFQDVFHSEANSSLSHVTPQKRAALLDEHSPFGMQLSTNKKLKFVVTEEEE